MQHISKVVEKTITSNAQLVEALDKLLALYRKETGLLHGDNPITLEAERLLASSRRA